LGGEASDPLRQDGDALASCCARSLRKWVLAAGDAVDPAGQLADHQDRALPSVVRSGLERGGERDRVPSPERWRRHRQMATPTARRT